jgi:hypothetical protein
MSIRAIAKHLKFRYINAQVAKFLDSGEPVISVDTKKKLRHEVARSE